jgi:GAF domain-containing protein
MNEDDALGTQGAKPLGLPSQLRRVLLSVEASGRTALSLSAMDLLQSVVEAAAQIFGAAAASISLVDVANQELDFKVACGVGREQIIHTRLPLDQGIAGYVAMSGLPLAISDVQADPRFGADFARQTGYVPKSILATPLIYDDRVIGVMEVLDKINAPSFGMQDMELLGVFARQAAIAIHQSQEVEALGEALIANLRQLLDQETAAAASELFAAMADDIGDDQQVSDDMVQLAGLFYAISAAGPFERRACLQILAAFRDYTLSKPSLGQETSASPHN